MMENKIVVAIPAYNEAIRIESIIHQCKKSNFTVWVIDDGSSDSTAEIAERVGARVIHHQQNMGKGMAIQTALTTFLQSPYPFLILMDADGQHDPHCIPAFVQCAETSRADIILGNRMFSLGAMPLIRRWTNQFMSWFLSWFIGQKIPDSQCGYRLVSRAFAEKFKPTSHHFDLESEMLIQAASLGLKIESIPIPTIYKGQSSHIHPLRDAFRFIKLIIRYSKKGKKF